jgi:hypothetical protein
MSDAFNFNHSPNPPLIIPVPEILTDRAFYRTCACPPSIPLPHLEIHHLHPDGDGGR